MSLMFVVADVVLALRRESRKDSDSSSSSSSITSKALRSCSWPPWKQRRREQEEDKSRLLYCWCCWYDLLCFAVVARVESKQKKVFSSFLREGQEQQKQYNQQGRRF